MKSFYYKVFGLNIDSEIELPNLKPTEFIDVDVTMRLGPIPATLPNNSKEGISYQASPNDFILKIETVGSYRVQNGNKITISPNSKANSKEVILFLLGSTLGALFHQRGLLPLHGCSILSSDNEAIIVIGESAVGKSTLAADLAIRGFPILTDDISVLTMKNDNQFLVQPGLPYLKLWKDVIVNLKIESSSMRIRPQIEKYSTTLNRMHHLKPAEVKKIICLKTKNSKGYTYKNIEGFAKFELLRNNTYRYPFIEGFGLQKEYFTQLIHLSNSITLSEIERPLFPLLIKELGDYFIEKVVS